MANMARIDVRNLTDEEKQKAIDQAKTLGMDVSAYIRLIINLDAASGLITQLIKAKKK